MELKAGPYKCVGYQQLTPSAATGLTVPAGARVAVITVTGQDVRYRSDGTNPDSTHGVLIKVGAAPFMFQGDLNTVKFIQASATAVMDIEYLA